ncbi:MAG: hypothetical protein A3J70_14495 [Elusimicrobia bacterium RIFCSPHIGHO2_02_FULL_61_10]|nr:MAG: hypothetical protein A3J70_14495 [Elusimicrobia bacterium RIFCSPHIGHO2_02_FULL_61_10]
MKRKGPQKYSTEVIQSAISKFESGARLSAISKELGVPKNTVKHWLDHASKYLPESAEHPVATRIHNRLARETWDIIFAALKVLKGKLPDASVRDLIAVVSELFDRQAQFGALTGKSRVPERVLEKSEEVRIRVETYLKKRTSGESPKSSLGGAPLERSDAPAAAAEPIDITPEPTEGNGAA